jgi:hypothetical protein
MRSIVRRRVSRRFIFAFVQSISPLGAIAPVVDCCHQIFLFKLPSPAAVRNPN